MKKPTNLITLLLASGLFAQIGLAEYALPQLKKLESRVQAAVKRAIPATVSVHPKNFSGAGSGVIVSNDGYVLTAAHVVVGGNEASLVFPDGHRVDAEVLSRNPRRDIALLKITEPGDYPYVEIGESKELKVTDILIALGHPGGYDIRRSAPIRIGRVYTPGMQGFIVTDCTLVGGDSGGPLIDLDGKVVGIHSSIGGTLSNNNHAPVHAATDHWEDMKAGKNFGMPQTARNTHPDQPVLGIVLESRGDRGVPITGVVAHSPAAKADLEVGDVIVAFDGKDIGRYDEFFELLNDKKVGDNIALTVMRGDEKVNTSVKLGRRGDIYADKDNPRRPSRPQRPQRPEFEPAEPAGEAAFLGLYFDENSSQPIVSETVPGSGAHKARLQAGDKILYANKKNINNVDDLRAVLAKTTVGDILTLEIARDGKKQDIEVTLGARPAELR